MRCIILFVMLGASSLGSVFRETNELESIKVVHHAIKSGINYIDVAPWYGHGKAETVLGKVSTPYNSEIISPSMYKPPKPVMQKTFC